MIVVAFFITCYECTIGTGTFDVIISIVFIYNLKAKQSKDNNNWIFFTIMWFMDLTSNRSTTANWFAQHWHTFRYVSSSYRKLKKYVTKVLWLCLYHFDMLMVFTVNLVENKNKIDFKIHYEWLIWRVYRTKWWSVNIVTSILLDYNFSTHSNTKKKKQSRNYWEKKCQFSISIRWQRKYQIEIGLKKY